MHVEKGSVTFGRGPPNSGCALQRISQIPLVRKLSRRARIVDDRSGLEGATMKNVMPLVFALIPLAVMVSACVVAP